MKDMSQVENKRRRPRKAAGQIGVEIRIRWDHDVKGVGRAGQIVTVSDSTARQLVAERLADYVQGVR